MNYTPARSTSFAGAAGAVSIIVTWVASLFGLEVPDYIGQAFTLLVTAGFAQFTDDHPPNSGPPVDPSHP